MKKKSKRRTTNNSYFYKERRKMLFQTGKRNAIKSTKIKIEINNL
jgi:hypothetical protein